MKDKLEPNMYIRTKDGKIAKFIKYDEKAKEELVTDYYEYSTIWIKDVIKASHNIIDLIEVGDYVNGEQVRYIEEDTYYRVLAIDEDYTYIIAGYDCDGFTRPIKSIVTKEQFSSMKYKLGDDE